MLVAPEMRLDRVADALGRLAVPLGERRLVPRRHRRGRDEAAVGRGRAVRVLAVRLLPEVDARQREARLLVHEAAEEVRGRASGGPQLAVERRISKLAPRGLVREDDHPGLVELVEAPARRQRAVRPVALEPEPLRRLLAREPAKRGHREIAAAGGEEAEHDVAQVARPDEAVATRLLEGRIELGRRDRRARLPVGELLEHEQGARVESGDVVSHPSEAAANAIASRSYAARSATSTSSSTLAGRVSRAIASSGVAPNATRTRASPSTSPEREPSTGAR